MKNITVSVPDGAIDHGVENLICVPPRGYDLIVFFCVNYLAHVFTAIHPPGATIRERLITALYAMFVPGSGITRALRSIVLHARVSSGLESAARAGALCMVLKKKNIHAEEEPGQRSTWFNNVFHNDDDARLVPTNRSVHGTFKLPSEGGVSEEYFLAEVPPGTPLGELQIQPSPPPDPQGFHRFIQQCRDASRRLSRDPENNRSLDSERTVTSQVQRHPAVIDLENVTLGNNWNPLALVVSLFQAGYGVYTLYKARGNQIETYGFTAFGLTVVPYVFMAIVNTVAALVTPQFPCMFLINTEDMDGQVKDGNASGTFIAEVKSTEGAKKTRLDFLDVGPYRRKIYEALLMFLFFVPLGITVGLSLPHLYVSDVRKDQVAFVSLWQISNAVSPWWLRWVDRYMSESMLQQSTSRKDKHSYRWLLAWLLRIIPVFVPAIGGMYYVGLMIAEYGSCIRISSGLV